VLLAGFTCPEPAGTGAGASNVIPASATVSIDMRLVMGMDAKQTADRLIAHIRKQGYFVTETEPHPRRPTFRDFVPWPVADAGCCACGSVAVAGVRNPAQDRPSRPLSGAGQLE
jgi:acetylornithine deacetylase/succinyl-diaminopimelate desuccinylase-like protein